MNMCRTGLCTEKRAGRWSYRSRLAFFGRLFFLCVCETNTAKHAVEPLAPVFLFIVDKTPPNTRLSRAAALANGSRPRAQHAVEPRGCPCQRQPTASPPKTGRARVGARAFGLGLAWLYVEG